MHIKLSARRGRDQLLGYDSCGRCKTIRPDYDRVKLWELSSAKMWSVMPNSETHLDECKRKEVAESAEKTTLCKKHGDATFIAKMTTMETIGRASNIAQKEE